jgi:hypothetical protein
LERSGFVDRLGLEVKFKMDHVLNAIAVVNQAQVAADYHVSAVAGRRRQTVREILRNRPAHPPHVGIEYVALAQTALIFGCKSVTLPETFWEPVVVVLVPIARFTAIAVVKPPVVAALVPATVAIVIIAILSTFPRHRRTA